MLHCMYMYMCMINHVFNRKHLQLPQIRKYSLVQTTIVASFTLDVIRV